MGGHRQPDSGGSGGSGLVTAACFRHLPAPGLTPVEHVPPVESCASLQALSTSSSPARGNSTLLTLPPRGTARSPSVSRLLCRQVGGAPPQLLHSLRGVSLPIKG